MRKHTVVRQSSATETTQPHQSNESCEKLRRCGNVETGDFADASAIAARRCSITRVLNIQRIRKDSLQDRCQQEEFVARQSSTESGLPWLTSFSQKHLKANSNSLLYGDVA